MYSGSARLAHKLYLWAAAMAKQKKHRAVLIRSYFEQDKFEAKHFFHPRLLPADKADGSCKHSCPVFWAALASWRACALPQAGESQGTCNSTWHRACLYCRMCPPVLACRLIAGQSRKHHECACQVLMLCYLMNTPNQVDRRVGAVGSPKTNRILLYHSDKPLSNAVSLIS